MGAVRLPKILVLTIDDFVSAQLLRAGESTTLNFEVREAYTHARTHARTRKLGFQTVMLPGSRGYVCALSAQVSLLCWCSGREKSFLNSKPGPRKLHFVVHPLLTTPFVVHACMPSP